LREATCQERYRSCETQRARGNMAGEKKPESLWQRGRRDTEVARGNMAHIPKLREVTWQRHRVARGNVQGSVGWALECLHCEVSPVKVVTLERSPNESEIWGHKRRRSEWDCEEALLGNPGN
jgi:hypothetical protein